MSDDYKACPFAKELCVQGTTGEPSKTVGWLCSAVCDKCPARNPLRHGYNSVFNQITQSPEVLAERSVYAHENCRIPDGATSPFIDNIFWFDDEKGDTWDERFDSAWKKAIAATVERLKEVCDD